jgi:16S rRNA processing protein RimM
LSGAERPGAREPLVVAELLRAHGIRGEMMARVSGVEAEDLLDLSLRMERRGGDSEAVRIRGVRPGGGGWIVTLEGVDDRGKAEELRGARLFARREDLPTLATKCTRLMWCHTSLDS